MASVQITNPAFDYDKHGQSYSTNRQTDPRVAEYVYRELDNAQTILNVGAGSGSYEPPGKQVTAVEPSAEMRQQRIKLGRTPAVDGVAEKLPFEDNSFDAAMATVTVHQWTNVEKGLSELSRVARDKVVVMTFDPQEFDNYWVANYFPEIIDIERQRFPTVDVIVKDLGGSVEVKPIPIPRDCVDGFQEAYFGRPEVYLDPKVRSAQSAWKFLPEGVEAILVKRLEDDLASGEWDRKYGHHRTLDQFIGSLKLIVAKIHL